ncbi:MAG: YciI family protein [Steroidobacteraceae bacterium]|jgi:hypothetical protein
MAYLLLIVEPRGQREDRDVPHGRDAYESMVRYGEGLQQRGVLLATGSLRHDRHGARLSVRGGKRTVVDGPFTEAKELVGGYFLIDVETRDEALAFAGECPAAEWATIEVRELGPCYD